MFSKLISIALLAAATTAVAQCDTGALQCCQSVQSAGNPALATILKSIGVVVQDANVPVGVTCSPISVVGVGSGSSCSANPVCCTDTGFNGVVALGCTPIDGSL